MCAYVDGYETHTMSRIDNTVLFISLRGGFIDNMNNAIAPFSTLLRIMIQFIFIWCVCCRSQKNGRSKKNTALCARNEDSNIRLAHSVSILESFAWIRLTFYDIQTIHSASRVEIRHHNKFHIAWAQVSKQAKTHWLAVWPAISSHFLRKLSLLPCLHIKWNTHNQTCCKLLIHQVRLNSLSLYLSGIWIQPIFYYDKLTEFFPSSTSKCLYFVRTFFLRYVLFMRCVTCISILKWVRGIYFACKHSIET